MSRIERLNRLSSSLSEIQDNTIGLFRHPLSGDTNVELVLEESNGTFNTVSIGNLLGMSTCSYGTDNFNYIKFPDGKTMGELMNDPFEFQKFYKLVENFEYEVRREY